MADGFIQVAPDGTGKKMQTFVNNDEHAEAVVLVDENGNVITALPVTDNGGSLTVDGTVAISGTVPVSGPLTDAQLRAVAVPVSGTFWQATQPVSVAATITTKETRSPTATTSQVADTASSTTLLALNANRLGATIQNDSSAALYVKLGTTATATDYTVRMVQYAYYEVPFGYTGRIDGIWATDPGDGAARITELT